MVYVDPKNLGYQPYMDKWINTRNESERNILKNLCDKYVHGAISLIIDGMLGLQQVSPLKMIIPQTSLNMVIPQQIHPIIVKKNSLFEPNQSISNIRPKKEFVQIRQYFMNI